MNDITFMSMALRLAKKGLYTTRPNPRVGCVIVKDDVVVGQGFHVRAGEPHAEIHALGEAGERARDATAYITLEPCSHHGRTPPCADALVSAGVKRVVVAMTDPNPQVSGRGLKRLHDAGIEVAKDVLQPQAEKLNPGFIKRMRTGLPWVRVKLAMSLDGRTAMASGESQWITGKDARTDVHRLRARSCAIMTGTGTVLTDNPSLTFRLGEHEGLQTEIPAQASQPLRVVVDSRCRTPIDARLLSQPGNTLIATIQAGDKAEALSNAGAEVLTLPVDRHQVPLEILLQELADRQINEVLVEAGARLAGAMLEEGLVDELVIYMAAHLMGDQAKGLVHLPGISTMRQRQPLRIQDIRAVGDDWKITVIPVR
ncbi:MAG: bifunctional diaminohydroxyphosphoribosylaminopyrimidine deaminase/5-amino-6-(5-phosphoribosylamino)uracil reductase RibD [Gammaproteobacteria bacterium]|nr:MAG: bifunctional diaminohydroxyphosphoribosylaminopyrimidine deaminase/5-amino-6-(5-phosphoribosylamino)uracil reductase RibD [Gammaproteobacteria bacterium]